MSSIKKVIAGVLVLSAVSFSTEAQLFKDVKDKANNLFNTNKGGQGSLTKTDISNGLKEALQVGAKNATNQVSAPNGFFGNALIKVLMPPEAKKVESTLREVGMGSYVDNAILSMNRAAEDASTKALPIFINAIKNMTIEDAVGILNGGPNSATNFLKSKTTAQLTAAFRPIIETSLDKVNATKYWAEVFNVYNELPTTFNKVNPDLAGYVTDRALNGVFVYIAEEENKIRANPAARVTDLLKKVFDNVGKK